MTQNSVVEAASWRIWYRLKERGECTEMNLMANCGIEKEVFDRAIDELLTMGQVEEVDHNDKADVYTYALADNDARVVQVYPTIHRQEL